MSKSQRSIVVDKAVERLRQIVPEGVNVQVFTAKGVPIPSVVVGISGEEVDDADDGSLRRRVTITFGVQLYFEDYNQMDELAERIGYEFENDMLGFHPVYLGTNFDIDDGKVKNVATAQVDFSLKLRRFGT